MPVFIINKFDEDKIKNKVAVSQTTLPPLCLWDLLVAVETNQASILYKSITGRYQPVSYSDRLMMARYRFM